jgi:hypothetical protein
MKKFIIILILLILVPIVLLAYLGFVPGISQYVTKPVDLGIKTDKSLVTAFETKYSAQKDTSGKVNLDVSLTSEQVTSIFAVWEDRDMYFPLRNVQVRFNKDGTGEASGYLKIATAISLAKNLGYDDVDIQKGKDYIKYVSGDLPFYVKGTASMTNNSLAINPSTFQVGRLNVPESIISPLKQVVGDMITRRIKQIGGADIKEASFATGALRLIGTVPDTIKY